MDLATRTTNLELLAAHAARRPLVENPAGKLTPRARQVFLLLAEGMSCRQIAERLGIAIKTADVHRGKVLRDLGLDDHAALVRFAILHGYVRI